MAQVLPFLIQATLIFRWEPARPLQRSLNPSGPEMPKKSRNCLSGPPAPGPPKSLQKVPRTLQKHSPHTFWRLSGDLPDCPRDFFETFWGPGPLGPGDIFETFLAFLARSGRSACAPLCCKTCAACPVFARVVGEAAGSRSKQCPRACKAKCWPRGTI